jgi:hypothetical protein
MCQAFRPRILPKRRFSGYIFCMSKTNNGRLLHRILETVSSSLNEEAARKLIGLKADRKAQARIAQLANKCNEGDLTPEERQEYEMYVMAGHFLAILQAKARIILACIGKPASYQA